MNAVDATASSTDA